jgi:hypothetical protein
MWTFLAMTAAAAAQGSPGAGDLQTLFRLMDRNGDGFITSDETPRLSNVRGQGVGNVTVRSGATWIARYDRDGDARVSRGEFVGGAQAETAAYGR